MSDAACRQCGMADGDHSRYCTSGDAVGFVPDEVLTVEGRVHRMGCACPQCLSAGTWRVVDTLACQWYALCADDATGVIAHPTLGDVPACDACQGRYEKLR
jgi:hypothetical protein